MKEKDIVVLKFSQNNCYTDLVFLRNIKDKEFSIDLNKGQWSYHIWKGNKIGEDRTKYDGGHRARYGIIGVYDRTNLQHLENMISASQDHTTGNIYDED